MITKLLNCFVVNVMAVGLIKISVKKLLHKPIFPKHNKASEMIEHHMLKLHTFDWLNNWKFLGH